MTRVWRIACNIAETGFAQRIGRAHMPYPYHLHRISNDLARSALNGLRRPAAA
jgi:hypothetical protein